MMVYPCAVVSSGDGKPRLQSTTDSCTMDMAMRTIQMWRGMFTVYAAWIERYNYENGKAEKEIVWFETYIDGIGNVRKS